MNNLKRRGTSAVPPKKSHSAYNIFGKEKRAEIMLRNPNAKVCEVVREMAATWAGMSNNQKSRFVDRAKQGKCFKVTNLFSEGVISKRNDYVVFNL